MISSPCDIQSLFFLLFSYTSPMNFEPMISPPTQCWQKEKVSFEPEHIANIQTPFTLYLIVIGFENKEHIHAAGFFLKPNGFQNPTYKADHLELNFLGVFLQVSQAVTLNICHLDSFAHCLTQIIPPANILILPYIGTSFQSKSISISMFTSLQYNIHPLIKGQPHRNEEKKKHSILQHNPVNKPCLCPNKMEHKPPSPVYSKSYTFYWFFIVCVTQ